MFKLTIAENAVKEKVIHSVKKEIDQQITKITHEINKKTILYLLGSFAGILLLIPFPKIVFYVASFVMIALALYLMTGFIQNINRIRVFLNDFEQNIKKTVEREINKQKEESVKNKLGLWLSGHSYQDIENLCISYSVRESIQKFNQHKWKIVVRIVFYIIACYLFNKVLFYMFT